MSKRLFSFALFAFSILASPLAFADAPVTQWAYATFTDSGTGCTNVVTQYDFSFNTAVTNQLAYYQCGDKYANGSSYTVTDTLVSSNQSTNSFVYNEKVVQKSNGYVALNTNKTVSLSTRQWCQDGSQPTGSPLTCPALCKKGATQTYTWKVPPTNATNSQWSPFDSATDGACEVDVTDVINCWSTSSGLYCSYHGATTGNQLAASSTVPAPASASQGATDPSANVPPFKDSSCPGGTVQGGIDPSGIPICMGTGTSPKSNTSTTTAPTTTTNNADGSSTAVSTQSQTNSDGSVTTTTTTTNTAVDGTVTVSRQVQTSATPSGSAGVPNATSTDNSLCRQNPSLAICQNSTVSGTCGDISCTGDAIQCATLRAAAQIQCQQAKDLADLQADSNTALGKSIVAGADPKQGDINTMLAGTTVDLSQPNLDQSGWLGPGACLAPITIQVMGNSLTASFDSVCQAILPIRAAVLLIAFIISYLLVSRSVLQS